jgi:hypothetical protein
VAAASGDYDSLHRSLADQAWFAFTAIDAVLQLEKTFTTLGVDVIGNRGTTQRNRFLQDFPDGQVEPPQVVARQG